MGQVRARPERTILKTVVFRPTSSTKIDQGKAAEIGSSAGADERERVRAFRDFPEPRVARSRRRVVSERVRQGSGLSVYYGEPQPLPCALVAAIGSVLGKQNMAAPRPVRKMRFEQMKIFTGNANPALAAKICASLGCTVGAAAVEPFSDGEIRLQILENVRGADVFVVQPTCTPVDRHLMELLLMIDALKRASAERITAVLPYYGYARQDRKDKPRMPISARLIANLIQRAGADRVLTLDLHAAQIQGFFDVPVDHLFAAPVMLEYFDSIGRRDMTVVSPDAGGVERARAFRETYERAAGDYR